jgi:hypothetical protein
MAASGNEVQELFRVGTVTATNPAGSDCTGGGVGFQIDLTIDGGTPISQQFPAPAPGQTVTSSMALGNAPPFAEPGAATPHTASVSVGENCPGTDHLTLSFTFDVLGFR